MALIKCPECGRDISDKAEKCPLCGYPVSNKKDQLQTTMYTDVDKFKAAAENKRVVKNECCTARMTYGIVLIVFSCFVAFQSCAASMVNIIGQTGGSDGFIGFFTWAVMLICGVISIVTRNTKIRRIPLILGFVLLVYGFLISYMYHGAYKDLRIWGWLMMIGSLLFIKSWKAMKLNQK